MLLLIANSSSLQEVLQQAAAMLDWRWAAIGVIELALWFVLWRTGFRIRHLPNHIACALKRIRGIFKSE
jgi:hypothetical protein